MTTVSQPDDHPEDPLVESLLEELVGGAAPPDLSARILARLQKQTERIGDEHLDQLAAHASSEAAQAKLAPSKTSPSKTSPSKTAPANPNESKRNRSLPSNAPSDPHQGVRSIVVTSRERRARHSLRQKFVWVLVGGGVCACLVWVSRDAWKQDATPASNQVADSETPKGSTDPRKSTPRTNERFVKPRPDPARPAADPINEPTAGDDSAPTPPPKLDRAVEEESPEPLERPSVETQMARAPATGEAIVQRIDQELAARWARAQVVPSAPVKDEIWCERVFQRLVGRDPLPAERRAFVRNESPNKRHELIDQILNEPKYRREYAEHWSKLWTNWLVGNASKNYQGGLQRYLQEAIADGQSYDRILSSLLTAEGSNSSSDADHNGATNYLLALADGGEPQMVSEVCRIALGQRADCARCHDSSLSDLKQDQFWQMAAIFEGMKIETILPGRHRISYDKSLATQVTFAFPEAPRKAYEPAYLDGSPLTGSKSPNDLREVLAERIVQSPQMPRAVVNRLWAQVFEYGFTFPVDDMGTHNPSEHGDLLEYLATQFAAHDFQQDALLRWMLLSDPMTRSSTLTAGNQSDYPDAGGSPLFSWFYDRSPFLFTSADQGLRRLADGNAPNVTSSTLENTNKMLNARRAQDLQKPEANGQLNTSEGVMGRLVPIGYLRLVRSLNTQDLSPEDKLEHVFRIVLHREPTKDERATAAKIFESAGGDSVVAMERIFWALINAR